MDFVEWISLARCGPEPRDLNGISQKLLQNQFENSGELAAKIIVSLLYRGVTRFFCLFWFENSEKIFDFFLKNPFQKTTARFVFLKGFLVSGQNLRNCGSRGPRQLAASFRKETPKVLGKSHSGRAIVCQIWPEISIPQSPSFHPGWPVLFQTKHGLTRTLRHRFGRAGKNRFRLMARPAGQPVGHRSWWGVAAAGQKPKSCWPPRFA